MNARAALIALLAVAAAFATQPVAAAPQAAVLDPLPASARVRAIGWRDSYQRWIEIALDMVGHHGLSAARCARVYAAVSMAQSQAWALVTAAPDRSIDPARAASIPISVASRDVLASLFPDEITRFDQILDEAINAERLTRTVHPRALADARALGHQAAAPVIAHLTRDGGNDAPWYGPAQVGAWRSRDGEAGVDPTWGTVQAWIPEIGGLELPPPPRPGSPAWEAAVAELRAVGAGLTAEQRDIAIRWAGGPVGYAPPDLWNLIALDLINRERLPIGQALEALRTMNVAMADAGIAAWRVKYATAVMRPWQADPGVVMLVKVPAFPSYPSGHSVFSWAAAGTLSAAVPSARAELTARAEEAALSRVYGGIHFRFDLEGGRVLGENAARLALRSTPQLPSTIISNP
ncbi:MAG: phosphatase PAP2 family protein [Thermoflexales bacterium]|nr:phosphatase PAP2 family protein [Thermoflexales bacterium]